MMARAAVIKWEIENVDEFIRDLDRLVPKADAGMSAALRSEAERIMARSQSEVPVRTGALKGSAHIGLPHRTARGVEVVFGYAAPYALYQHFGQYQHPQGGKSLFLEGPVRWARRGLTTRVKAVLARFL